MLMIGLTCRECEQTSYSEDEDIRLEIDGPNGWIYFRCPKCKKEVRLKLGEDPKRKPLPRIGGTRF